MVSHGNKKPSAPNRKRKVGAVEALLADPVDLSTTKAEKTAIKNSLTRGRTSSVVSAIVYNARQTIPLQNPAKTDRHSKKAGMVAASVFAYQPLTLTFTTKLRNVISYVFESLRDVVAYSTPPSADVDKSLREMRALNGSSENRLNEEIKRHLNELIEETDAFLRGEKTGLTGIPDFQSALHYRHYVRIAWLSNFILSNLAGPVPDRSGQSPSSDFPSNS
ncbi:MAG: hypothetical protein WBM07_13520 [Chitinivibrionales bacterium]